ncbi:hypothetical protein JZ751_005692, partial [Albula glossodonta]
QRPLYPVCVCVCLRALAPVDLPLSAPLCPLQETGANTILQDIARARENIQKSLAGMKTSLQHGKGRSRTPQNRRGQPVSARPLP